MAAKAFQVGLLLNGLRDTNGNPLNGGKVYTYVAGTTTNKTTWTDSNKGTPAANPIILDSNGIAQIYADGAYKFVIKDSSDVTLYTWDNLYFTQNPNLENNTALSATNNAGSGTVNLFKLDTSDRPVFLGAWYFNDSLFRLLADTSDGSDNKAIQLGYSGSTRGGRIEAHGNETSNTGLVALYSGDISGAVAKIEGSGSNGSAGIYTNSTSRMLVDSSGAVTGSLFDWTSWTPTYGANGSMTFTGTSTNHAKYIKQGKKLEIDIAFSGTVGGTPSTAITFTLPFSAAWISGGGASVLEGGNESVGAWVSAGGSTTVSVYLDQSKTYTAGSVSIRITATLEVL